MVVGIPYPRRISSMGTHMDVKRIVVSDPGAILWIHHKAEQDNTGVHSAIRTYWNADATFDVILGKWWLQFETVEDLTSWKLNWS